MENLMSKTPHYIRCIKPNEEKLPDEFDDRLCRHQVRYLGLLENVRVRRAGFCFRQTFEAFLDRYRMVTPFLFFFLLFFSFLFLFVFFLSFLSSRRLTTMLFFQLNEKTWPRFNGSPRDGCDLIFKTFKYESKDYQLGKTKVFIRFPITVSFIFLFLFLLSFFQCYFSLKCRMQLFKLEEERNKGKGRLATAIRANYLAHMYEKKFEFMKESAAMIMVVFRQMKVPHAYLTLAMSPPFFSNALHT